MMHLFPDDFLAGVSRFGIDVRRVPPRAAHGVHLSPRPGASLAAMGRGVPVVVSDFFEPAGVEALIDVLRLIDQPLVPLRVRQPGDADPRIDDDLELEYCESGDRLHVSPATRSSIGTKPLTARTSTRSTPLPPVGTRSRRRLMRRRARWGNSKSCSPAACGASES